MISSSFWVNLTNFAFVSLIGLHYEASRTSFSCNDFSSLYIFLIKAGTEPPRLDTDYQHNSKLVAVMILFLIEICNFKFQNQHQLYLFPIEPPWPLGWSNQRRVCLSFSFRFVLPLHSTLPGPWSDFVVFQYFWPAPRGELRA